MGNGKQKLELTWIGKNNPEYDITNIEPRILEECPDLSYGDSDTENMIIHGDNLLALKALLPEYEGKIKCIYIDPPYNTGHAFAQYDDSVEHSTWLSLMKPRIELLIMLLSQNGVFFVQLDDNEVHYAKIICDEAFGRNNFVTSIAWKRRASQANLAKFFAPVHDHILVYAKDKNLLTLNKVELREEYVSSMYKNLDNDPRGAWRTKPLLQGKRSKNPEWEVELPDGRKLRGRWRCSRAKYQEYLKDNRIYVPKDGVPNIKIFLSESLGQVANTFWDNAGTNEEAGSEIERLFGSKTNFETPKPERLISRILQIGSSHGDIILDSFLGSGTTSAVAHKMGRKYIGIEMGEHAYSLVHKRMKKIIDGADGLKLSEALDWQGGGGFKFYKLAPSFVSIDEFGNPVIDRYYNDTKLIRAMCKLMNFTFSPSASEYWKQGKGQGNNSIYVTTQMLSVAMVQQIASHLGTTETLLICPKKYEPGSEKVDMRITIKKIPQSILKACHFGKKEYLLPIKERAIEELDDEAVTDDES